MLILNRQSDYDTHNGHMMELESKNGEIAKIDFWPF